MKKFLLGIITVFTVFIIATAPVYAEGEKCTLTSILGNSKCNSDGTKAPDNVKVDGENYFNCSCDTKGDSIEDTLGFVVDILSVGVGILGVIGISIVGIQYLTAGGNEEQTRKSKRRLFDIIIGLAVYALMFALLKWFLPGFGGEQPKEDTSSRLNNSSISRVINQD